MKASNVPLILFWLSVWILIGRPQVFASEAFPYSVRTKNYSGQTGGIRGDINGVGMAGAAVAVPFSISAAQSNPAGLAMGMASVSVQILKNTIRDSQLQNSKIEYESNQWGFAVSPPLWGFGIM